jgi:hypothetical protein
VGSRVEGHESHTTDIEVGISQTPEKVSNTFLENGINGLRLIYNSELYSSHNGCSEEIRGGLESGFESWKKHFRVGKGEATQALRNHISCPLFRTLSMGEEGHPNILSVH